MAKKEICIPIPRKQTPTEYNDLRPIWMSLLRSKILELIVLEAILNETKNNWKPNQHGGIKGSSTDHIQMEELIVTTYFHKQKNDLLTLWN